MHPVTIKQLRRARMWCSALFLLTMSNVSAVDLALLKPVITPTSSAESQKRLKLSLSEVGTLRAHSKQLTVIDPGWMFPDRISRLAKKAPRDAATVRLAMITGGENEGMPAFIILEYGNLQDTVATELAELTEIPVGGEPGRIGVDSGEIAVIDATQIPTGDQATTLAFGESILKHVVPNKAVVIDPKKAAFVVAKSGNGDGAYPCYWLKDARNNILALLIDFENWTPAQNPDLKSSN